jgi:hypothetical protein
MDQQRDKKPEHDRESEPRRSKKPYARPVLVEYGHVAKLTQSGASAGFDFMGMMMSCL